MENTTKNQKVLVSSKIPMELEEKLKRIAEKERRTVSNVVYLLLETHPTVAETEVPQAA